MKRPSIASLEPFFEQFNISSSLNVSMQVYIIQVLDCRRVARFKYYRTVHRTLSSTPSCKIGLTRTQSIANLRLCSRKKSCVTKSSKRLKTLPSRQILEGSGLTPADQFITRVNSSEHVSARAYGERQKVQ